MRQADAERIADELRSESKLMDPLADVEHAVGRGDKKQKGKEPVEDVRLT
jgi:hypothetical protein